MKVTFADEVPELDKTASGFVMTERVSGGSFDQLEDAFRGVLAKAAAGLANLGALPPHLSDAVLYVHSRSEFEDALLELDLAFREFFAGNFPRITVVEDPGTPSIDALFTAIIPEKPTDAPVFKDFTQAEINKQYSPRAYAKDVEAVLNRWREAGPAFQKAHRSAEVFYGASPRQSFDIFMPIKAASTPPPIHVFIHGGYWQAIDKKNNAHAMAGLLEAGVAVALLNYDLMPEVDLAEIIRQTRLAMVTVYRVASDYGYDADRLSVSGHSAGGHLAGVMACTSWRREADDAPEDLVKAALPISGVFDLEPLSKTGMNKVFGFSETTINGLSPYVMTPRAIPIGLCVGGDESPEFHRQSQEFGTFMQQAGALVQHIDMPGHDHFTVIEAMADAKTALGSAVIDLALSA